MWLQESRRWYSITFIGSILWIAGFSYLMVWWAKEVGDTIGISEQVSPSALYSLHGVKLLVLLCGTNGLKDDKKKINSCVGVTRPTLKIPPTLELYFYNEVLGTMKITLLYQVSHYIRVQKQRTIKSWDQQKYLVIRGFCYIRPLYNKVPLYCAIFVRNCPIVIKNHKKSS